MKPTCPRMKLSMIAAPAAITVVKAALFAGILTAFAPAVVLGQSIEKKGTAPYVTHFVFRPLTSIDIAELGKATTLEAVGTTQNMKGEKMLDKMSAQCVAVTPPAVPLDFWSPRPGSSPPRSCPAWRA